MEKKMRLTFKSIIFSLAILLSFQANAKLGFVGIGVSNIEKSTKFYQDILGLDVIGTYDAVSYTHLTLPTKRIV